MKVFRGLRKVLGKCTVQLFSNVETEKEVLRSFEGKGDVGFDALEHETNSFDSYESFYSIIDWYR